jgi:transcriptional regulator with GAF, ATPase, and Fis domain
MDDLGAAAKMRPEDSALLSEENALRVFLRLGSTIALLDDPELYPSLLDAVFELIPAKRGAIILAAADGERFTSGVYRERGRQADAHFVPSSKTTHDVLSTGNPFMSNDHSPPALCALMRTRDQKLGVVYADLPLVPAGFAPQHLKYMIGIAGLASGASRQAKSVGPARAAKERGMVFAESGFVAGGAAHGLVGESPAMIRLSDQLGRAARNNRYVLILGEPGTGKELVARAIHQASPRADKPFLPINCASIPADMMESQMFGHEKGAFTGAVSQQIGWVEGAGGGTLFLDEIGDLPLALQPKLLRVLQEREFMRLGSSKTLRADVRVIAATNRDLEGMVKDGLFREDLLNRLEVFTIKVPPLRDRTEDILPLAWHFIRKNADLREVPVTQIDPEVERLFREFAWPGNVRRLENTIIYALGSGDGESPVITVDDLPESLRTGGAAAEEELTAERLQTVLKQAKGNRTQAARFLGISRAHFYRLLNELVEE